MQELDFLFESWILHRWALQAVAQRFVVQLEIRFVAKLETLQFVPVENKLRIGGVHERLPTNRRFVTVARLRSRTTMCDLTNCARISCTLASSSLRNLGSAWKRPHQGLTA